MAKEDEFTGAPFAGAQDVAGAPFTGAFEVTGPHLQVLKMLQAHHLQEHLKLQGPHLQVLKMLQRTPLTGAPFQMNDNFTGAQEKDVPTRVQEARRRLSLSLKKSKVPENFSQPNTVKKSSDIELVDSILIESSDSSHAFDVEYYEPDDNPGMGPAQYVFIPLGTGTRHCLAPLFGINRMGPFQNYSGIMKVCNGMPSRIETITGDGNCLFNSTSYVLCSSEQFNWEIRQELCSYIENNWSKVGCLAGCL